MAESGPELSAYRGRRVLITGGLGFLGMNLAVTLHRLGARVRLLDIQWPEHDSQLGSALKSMEFIKADLRDRPAIEAAVQNCDILFNLAGRSGAVASNTSPLDDLDINCRGQLTLLEACRAYNPILRVVFPSSRLVYAHGLPNPVTETAPTQPISIYGVHKLTIEKYHLLYAHLYQLPVVILRLTNPYGPHQRPEQQRYGIINWFIHLALQGQTLPVYGDGLQMRDYIHIDDVLRVFLWCGLDKRALNQVFNVSSGEAVRFVDMAKLIVRLVGTGEVEHRAWPVNAQQAETGDFVADIQRLKVELGWQPEISLEAGLRRVVDYYRAGLSKT